MYILLTLIFSTIGILYLKLAKSYSNMPVGVIGVTLVGYVYFTTNLWLIILIGLGLSFAGFYALKSSQ